MVRKKFNNILNKVLNLSEINKKELAKKLLENIVETLNRTSDYERKMNCPHCGHNEKFRNGTFKGRQRYLCKKCRKSFNRYTNTPISYTKKDLKLWEDYAEELLSCTTLEKTSEKLGISISTAFYWRHKILDSLRENEESQALEGNVKILELYMRESFKGNKNITKRKSFKSGRGKNHLWLDDNSVCIILAEDIRRNLVADVACLGTPKVENLNRIFKKNIKEQTVIIAKKSFEYKVFAMKNKLEYLPSLGRYSAAGRVYIRNLQKNQNAFEIMIQGFGGVATKYLANYISLYKAIKRSEKRLQIYLPTLEPSTVKSFRVRPYCFD